MKRAVLSSVVWLCAVTVVASAATLKVPSQYPTIQAGIEAANDGDVVLVAPGVYYETINFNGKNITVTSTDPNDRGIIGYTIINAKQDGSAVTFDHGETSAAVLTGFTITGGFGTLNTSLEGSGPIFWGGGIYCISASPTITKNIIAGNRGPVVLGNTNADSRLSYGGGIACIQSNAIVTHNVIRNNVGFAGGGLMIYIGQGVVSNNLIYDNSGYVGGGVCMIGGSLINNTIVNNNCDQQPGDGMAGNAYIIFEPQLGNTQVVNNIICNAPSGGGLLMVGSWQTATISCNNVYNNSPGNYLYLNQQTGETGQDGVYDQTGKNGNLSVDPAFRGAAFSKDYHLVFGSPCINAGDPAYASSSAKDIDNQGRVYGGRIDIGADEYVGYIKPVSAAGSDQHIVEPSQVVTLDGGESFFYDPAGVKTFRWAQISGPAVSLENADTETPSFAPSGFGEYVFELIVGDNQYEGDPDRVLILVAEDRAPIADAGGDRVCRIGGRTSLDGTGSYDPDVIDPLTYQWTQVEGEPVELLDADTGTPSFVAAGEGWYVFELVVSDGFMQSEAGRVRCVAVPVATGSQDLEVRPGTGSGPYQPDVSGMKIAYVMQSNQGDLQVAYKDLATGRLETLATGSYFFQPKVDGDLVVWYGGFSYSELTGPVCSSVFAHIAGGTQQTLRTRSATASYSHPAVSGSKVVWVQHLGLDRTNPEKWYNTPYDICGADLSASSSPVFFTVATNVGQRDPVAISSPMAGADRVVDISGDIVVWEGRGNIYAADISDLGNIKVYTVCDDPAEQRDPAISGRLVVWTDERNDLGDIYGADLSDLENIREFVVARGGGTQEHAAIDGPLVAYVDAGLLAGGIKLACVTRSYGVLDPGLPPVGSGVMPALDGRSLVWLGSVYGPIQGLTLDVGYSIFDGRVANARTGLRYDYLQHAVTGAEAGDQIVVGKGVYEENVNFAGKAVTIRSEDPNDPVVVAATVLRNDGAAVSFTSHEGADSVLDGFTVTGGSEAIYCYSSQPTVARCVVTGSTGAGMRLVGAANPTIALSRFVGNGAAGIEMSSPTEIRTVKQCEAVLRNCLIAGNRGQGVHGGKPTMVNCTITENVLDGVDAHTVVLNNSIVYFNASGGAQIKSPRVTASYSDIQNGWEGDGNIAADPLFVSAGQGFGAAWVSGDYHLKTQGWRWNRDANSWVSDDVTSPCIDAGDPTAELLSEPLSAPQSSAVGNHRIDMGVYGGTAEASLAP